MIDFVMFRKDIVDQILDTWMIEKYVGEGKGTYSPYSGGNNSYIKYGFIDLIADVPAFLDKMEEMFGNDSEAKLMVRHFQGLGGVFDWKGPNKVGWWVDNDGYRYGHIVRPGQLIVELMIEGKRDVAEQILKEHLKALYIDSFMHQTRHLWIPAGHEGDQGAEHEGYRCLIKAIGNALDREKAEWDEDDE